MSGRSSPSCWVPAPLPLPAVILLPILIVASMIGGGLMLLGPAFLKVRLGVD